MKRLTLEDQEFKELIQFAKEGARKFCEDWTKLHQTGTASVDELEYTQVMFMDFEMLLSSLHSAEEVTNDA